MECRACLSANPDTNRFCGNCGTSLNAQAARPGRAELKQATVLFADIVSSTEQIALLDPEAAMERLQPAILSMCAAVERFGGTVVRTTGDGVMALFGVPMALEGHATLACEAALQMQAEFGANARLRIRVGLHPGLVASDPQAPDRFRGGGAHGLTIHLASRVVAEAAPGQITLTADCRALVHRAQGRSLGMKMLKGIPHPTEILVLEGLVPASTHRQFERGRTPMRGRARELAAIHLAQAGALQGAGNVVGISGAPGAGKSRFCFEFASRCREQGVPVHEIHAQLYGHATPLQPALELLRVFFFRIPADADAATARQLVAEVLQAAGLQEERDTTLVHEFLGVSLTPDAAQLNPRARRARLLDVVRALFAQVAGTHAILVIEDLHWLDEASEEFVTVLVESIPHSRVLLVLNYRNSYRSRWLDLPQYRELALAELDPSDTVALVRDLMGNGRDDSDLYEVIARRCAGNPFFAEELVQSLVERGSLGEADASAADVSAIAGALPTTVQAVIGARIDRLGEAEKTVLQTCAIVGKEIPLGVLEQVTAMPVDVLHGVLDRLHHAQLVQPAESARHFAFRHPLIQEVAYATQLKSRRSAIHATVAGAMVGHYCERIEEYAALIAYHFAAAGKTTLAAGYEGKAAQWIGGVDSRQAIKHWHRVRNLLEGEVGDDALNLLKITANSKICWLGWREGLTFSEVKTFIDEASQLAQRCDPGWTQLLLMVEGRILQAGGACADLYVDRMERAIAMLDQDTKPGRAVTLNAALSQACGWAGLLPQALAANDAALKRIAHIDKFDVQFLGFSLEQWILALRARLFTRLGRFEEARACLDLLLEMTGESIDPVIVQMPHFSYVELAARTGDIELAREHVALASEIADRNQTPYLRVFALYGEALLHAMQAQFDEAARVLQETLALVRSARVALEFETEILASLAESHRNAQSMQLALSVSREAAELSSERGNRLAECRALMTWADIVMADPRLGAPGEAALLREKVDALMHLTGTIANGYRLGRVASSEQLKTAQLAPAA